MSQKNIKINLLKYTPELKLKNEDGTIHIFDPIRGRYFVQTPEEVVRQLTVLYLLNDRGFNKNKFAIERMLVVNERRKRFDILVYGLDTEPFLLVECKAPAIPISEDTFHQIATYNLALKVAYLVVTNGIDVYCCKMDYAEQSYQFLHEVPHYPEVSS